MSDARYEKLMELWGAGVNERGKRPAEKNIRGGNRSVTQKLVIALALTLGQISTAAATQIVSNTAQPACQTPDDLDAFLAVVGSGANEEQLIGFAKKRGCTMIPANTKVAFIFPALAGRYVHIIWMTVDGDALDLWAQFDPDKPIWVNADN